MVLYKYLNCIADKTANTDTGHTPYLIYNTDYDIKMILTMVIITLFISFCCKNFKANLPREDSCAN